MANPNPNEKTRFVKGQKSPSPGRPKAAKSVIEAAKANGELLTTVDLKIIISRYFFMYKDQLIAAINDPKTKAIDLIIASTIVAAIKNGDVGRAESLFIRCLGKVKDTVEVPHAEPCIIKRLDGSEVELGTKMGKTG